MQPLVSISCITYNHAPYIRDAIEGFLSQRTTFPFEVLVHDDASNDGTTEIIRECESRHPELILPIYEEENQWAKGRRGSAVFNFPRARGKYIALCEGDDYWTDPYKLQRQVDFLEAHPECSMCFHAYTVCFDDASRPPYVAAPPPRSITSLEDLLVRDFIGTLTVMFRRRATQELPDWYYELAIGDWPLHILNAQYGDIGYIESVMGVHRVHRGGIWSSSSHVQRGKAALQMYYHLRSYLGARYQKSIKTGMAKAYLGLAAAYADEENIEEAKTNLWRSVAECPMNGLRQLEDVVALALRLYTPQIHTILKRIWRLPTASV